jgi:hypothetical protein
MEQGNGGGIDLPGTFIVHPDHLLVVSDDSCFNCCFSCGFRNEGELDAFVLEHGGQSGLAPAIPADTDQLWSASQTADIAGHIARATEFVFLALDYDHGYWGFGRNPLHTPELVVVEHDIADDQDWAVRQGTDLFGQSVLGQLLHHPCVSPFTPRRARRAFSSSGVL